MAYHLLMKTFVEIIDRWPSMSALAADLGVPYVNVQIMRFRDSIAAEHWSLIEEKAIARGIDGVTVKLMADIKASRSKHSDGKPRPSQAAVA